MTTTIEGARILVTGGAGFIGSNVCRHLWEADAEVRAIDDLSRGRSDNLDDLRGKDGFSLYDGSITDPGLLQKVAKDCDAIYHLAASPGNPENPQTDVDVNIQGTINVLELARKSSQTPDIVFSSTNKVYGDNVNRIDLDEEETRYVAGDPEFEEGVPETLSVDQAAHGSYGLTKLAADLAVQDYAEAYGIRTGVFRQSSIYGPHVFGGWIGFFLHSALKGETLTIHGNGKQLRDPLYVSDLAEAYDAFVESDVSSGVWNVGGGPEFAISLREFVDLIADVTGSSVKRTFETDRDMGQRFYVSDLSRIQEDLDWQPTVGPREGLERTVDWARTQYENGAADQ